MFQNLKNLFDLRQDQHDHEVIDASIRAGVRIGELVQLPGQSDAPAGRKRKGKAS
jgi:hypothetical protein